MGRTVKVSRPATTQENHTMADKPNPYKEGMRDYAEGQTEKQNPYRRGTPNWTRWLGGHRYARELVESAQEQERRILEKAWRE